MIVCCGASGGPAEGGAGGVAARGGEEAAAHDGGAGARRAGAGRARAPGGRRAQGLLPPRAAVPSRQEPRRTGNFTHILFTYCRIQNLQYFVVRKI